MTMPSWRVQVLCDAFVPVGSRVTCNPPPKGTDADFLVLPRFWRRGALRRALLKEGFEAGSYAVPWWSHKAPSRARFESFRRGQINIIVAGSREFFDRFMAATHVAKRLNLLRKSDRVALFQAVLYGASK